MEESAGRLRAQEGPDPAVPESAGSPAADDVPPPPPPLHDPSDRAWHRRFGEGLADIVRGVWRKGEQDNIFFLAGAISFNVLVAFVPLLIAVVGIAGTVLRFLAADAQQTLLSYLAQTIPAVVNLDLETILDDLADQSTGILSIGTLFFLWVATRLVGTLRTVLREIFDIADGRNIVTGKIFDIKMVFAAGTLFALNVALTLGLQVGAEVVSDVLRIDPGRIPFMNQATQLWPALLAFLTIWVMFFLVYRYLPPRRIRWSTASIAATFTAIIGEALKLGFGWYVTGVADFRSAWGNIATFVILVLWVYYTSIVFILGGEVAQVISMRRIRRRQKERLV